MQKKIWIRFLLIALVMLGVSASSYAQVRVAITFGPPELPVYDQPPCPGDDFIWTPGYWAWGDDDYYWVPGTWVPAPEAGFFWTPGYWGWVDNSFVFYDGYWGPQVGFYGGINYGFGYFGHGYEGGRWDHDHFFYNRAVNNVNVTKIHNVYNTTIVNNNTNTTRVSYNGGNGGINERPTSQEDAAAHERHIPPVAAQTQHLEAARSNPQLRASSNHGKPPIAATVKPAEFNGSGAVAAKQGGRYTPPPNRGGNAAPQNRTENSGNPNRPENNGGRPANIVHPNDLPAMERPAAPNTGNPKMDRKYQQEQQKLQQKQEQDRQKLQQKQDQEHQRMDQQKVDDARKQQMEQRHQQQTQELQQRHQQQQQQMQQRQAPRQAPPPERPAPPPKPARPPQ